MRLNRSKTGRRRSHHALAAKRPALCECGGERAPHRACQRCGKYNGRVVIDVVARTKREQRRSKRKDQELKQSGQSTEKKDVASA